MKEHKFHCSNYLLDNHDYTDQKMPEKDLIIIPIYT